MVNKRIMDCLFGVVGFHQNGNPDYETLTEDLTESTSGLYVQDENALLCIENIDQALKNYDAYNYPAFQMATVYPAGSIVRASDGKAYISAVNGNTGQDPAGNAFPVAWPEDKPLSQKLRKVMRSAIVRLNSTMFNEKGLNEVVKTLVKTVQLYSGVGNLFDKEIKLSRFVGFQVVVEQESDIDVIIQRIGTQFSQPNPNFKLYIYHSSQSEPMVYELALQKTNSFEWSQVKDINGNPPSLKYMNAVNMPGGAYYIGYYEDELQGQAVNNSYDFGVVPSCGSCSNDLAYYNQWSGYVSVTPFYVSAGNLVGILPSDPGGAQLWDINKNQYTYTRNYGLNMDLTVQCDVTDLFCQQSQMFADAILKQVTVDLLQILANTTRNNTISKEVSNLALYELNKPDSVKNSATYKLNQAIGALSFNFSGINELCLPCNNKPGVTWGTVS